MGRIDMRSAPSHGRIGKKVAVVVLTTAFAVGVGVDNPARANDFSAGGGFVATSSGLDLHQVQATLNAEVIPIGLGNVLILFDCKAVAVPDPASTHITECSVGNTSAPPLAYPGHGAATAGFLFGNADESYSACVAAKAEFMENIAGPFVKMAPRKCGTLITTGA